MRAIVLKALTMAALVFITGAIAQTWDCGAVEGKVTCTLGENGIFTVNGSGAMKNYSSESPWYDTRSSITSLVIGSGVTSVGNYAFRFCRNLTSVTIPNSVTSIGAVAFSSCDKLVSVTIPANVTSIERQAFMGCDGLINIEVDRGNAKYSSVDGVLFNKTQDTLVQYGGGRQGAYSIPNSVTCIGVSAFSNMSGLTSVTIPASVTSIGNVAFGFCSGLTSIICLAKDPPSLMTAIGNTAFNYIDMSIISLHVPQGSIDSYSAADGWKSFGSIQAANVSALTSNRVIPNGNTGEVAVVAPAAVLSGEFAAGPNPVGRSSGGIVFFWNGKQIKSGTLTVYDAAGNVVKKIIIKDNAVTGNLSKRAVGSWDLKDGNGHPVSEGTYLVRGQVATFDGKSERAAMVVGVR